MRSSFASFTSSSFIPCLSYLDAIGITFVLPIVVTLMLASLLAADFLARLARLRIYHHVLAACAEVSLRTLGLALAYAWLRHWHAGLARGLVWAACVCPLHQQLLGYSRDIFRWRLDSVVTRGSITAQRR